MWPRNASTVARSAQGRGAAAFRALLFVACVCTGILVARAQDVETFVPREKDVRRAEKVLEKLRLLDEAAASREDGDDFRRLARKFYPDLFVIVAEMSPGDLKTDLDTAVFLYEDVSRTWSAAGQSAADCEGERPDLYLPLCRELGGGAARQLLLLKARLHARWAEAVVKTSMGAGDGETARLLSQMKAARALDARIAARVSETLKSLEGVVSLPTTYSDYQEQRGAATVSSEKLDAEFSDALGRAGVLLSWMPRSPAYYHLSRARRSYSDGLFWYRKVQASKKMTVSAAAGFDRDPLKDLRLDAERVGYTVVSNWKTAAKYTRLAEQTLAAATR